MDIDQTTQTQVRWHHTRMVMEVKQIHWSSLTTNAELYGKIRERRLSFSGHCMHHLELPVSNLVLWTLTQRARATGIPRTQSQYAMTQDSNRRNYPQQ